MPVIIKGKRITIESWRWKPIDTTKYATVFSGLFGTRKQVVGSGAVFWDENKCNREFRNLRDLLEHMSTYNSDVGALLREVES
jgi:hypothetical protein